MTDQPTQERLTQEQLDDALVKTRRFITRVLRVDERLLNIARTMSDLNDPRVLLVLSEVFTSGDSTVLAILTKTKHTMVSTLAFYGLAFISLCLLHNGNPLNGPALDLIMTDESVTEFKKTEVVKLLHDGLAEWTE